MTVVAPRTTRWTTITSPASTPAGTLIVSAVFPDPFVPEETLLRLMPEEGRDVGVSVGVLVGVFTVVGVLVAVGDLVAVGVPAAVGVHVGVAAAVGAPMVKLSMT